MFIHDIAPSYCRISVLEDKTTVLTVAFPDPDNPGLTSGFICTADVMSARVSHEDTAKLIVGLSDEMPNFINQLSQYFG